MTTTLDTEDHDYFDIIAGARDMLREAAKQFRALGQDGHAEMCDAHASNLEGD